MAKRTRQVVEGEERQPTRAAVELHRILIEDGPLARALRGEFTRQNLGKWRRGERIPEVNTIKRVRNVTKRRVEWFHWTETGTAG